MAATRMGPANQRGVTARRTRSPSRWPRRVAGVAHPAPPHGLAGRSARVEHERAWRKHRRRRTVSALVGALAGGWAVLGCFVAPGGRTLGWLVLAGAALVVAFLVWPRDDPGRWGRGAAGEEATAELLARLPARRWTVFHDLG